MTVQNASAVKTGAVGIDLGTTNSVVAVCKGQRTVVIPTSQSTSTLPSIVSIGEEEEIIVGAAAKRLAATQPGTTYYSVKRFMGQQLADTKDLASSVAYGVKSDEEGAVQLQCDAVEGGVLYPEEVSAYILAELLSSAQAYLGSPVEKAVISVPAYFGSEQREATIEAGRLAGLTKIKLIREPVAAALAYGVSAERDETVLVLDLGGGTWDVSILEVGGGTIEVLATGGDANLGGDDFDNIIVDWLIRESLQAVDCTEPIMIARLKALAEKAKVALSEAMRVSLKVPVGGADGQGVAAVLTRQHFEKLATPLFERMRLAVDEACWQAGVDLGSVMEEHYARSKKQKNAQAQVSAQVRPKRRAPITRVLLVGGATRMPAFRRFVRNMTGLEAKGAAVDPDEAVAIGAAIQAGLYDGLVSGIMVMDIWQATLMRAFATQQLGGAGAEPGDDVDESFEEDAEDN
ncbi:g8531 [Coccomyxa viridis]|uniref:G8531 protein n=1 Tax=Coccomyxa viridis TaxID=1274662 RepID=A0ABP1G0J9_9CHLO